MRHHSIISTMLQCVACLAVVGVVWIIIGFSLAFGDDAGTVIGNPWTYLWFRNVGGAPNPSFAGTRRAVLCVVFILHLVLLPLQWHVWCLNDRPLASLPHPLCASRSEALSLAS